ncbi:ATP-dependent nuclease [Leptothrix discophora]|uniref:AAA family ATPase n=1 Tax=Leptothrix discophora TaxID=89 RepID=A0ABT9G0M8_LEPDI|nr:AAA family ATPase [Leptothrix discophora]MDP4300029.1 AAA family ATPase [Leptothrix discophora]
MKIQELRIHNYRSIIDLCIEVHDYTLLVGANNAGKSTVMNALRAFYDDLKWSSDDFPRASTVDQESWVQLTFALDDDEWSGLAEKYKSGANNQQLTVRRYFKSDDKTRVQSGQSNIFGLISGALDTELFYGAKNVGAAKVGQIVFVPALTTPAEQTKMSGPSPLRNMLNFLLKKVVAKSEAFKEVSAAFEKLNNEARQNSGFLSEISAPLNNAIASWNIKIDLSVGAVAPEDISKSLVRFEFVDSANGEFGFDLDRYGHGFQRSVIYELIRLAPTFKDEKKADKKEFNPTFSLVLFEEPEAFLHPSQQESMAYHLRRLGAEPGQQVIITTHSTTFAGKAAEHIGQLVRIQRSNGSSQAFQPRGGQIKDLFDRGGELMVALQAFIDDPKIPDNTKKRARDMMAAPPEAHIAEQEERFRFQLWLDGERASLFFADRVLLVEGATERALFNYLLANEWHDLARHRICVIDALGKFNLHRYMALLEAYGIPHGIMLDDDHGQNLHGAVNDLIDTCANPMTLAPPVKFTGCLEEFLDLSVPKGNDKKPLEIMKAITGGKIQPSSLKALRDHFCAALAIA